MPSINLRLTDEEHAALERWAHGAHRSLQREIIFRLFAQDIPKHVTEAITEVENKLTEDLRAATGRDDIVAEMDLAPINPYSDRPTPDRCGMSNRHRMNTRQNPCPRCGYPT